MFSIEDENKYLRTIIQNERNENKYLKNEIKELKNEINLLYKELSYKRNDKDIKDWELYDDKDYHSQG